MQKSILEAVVPTALLLLACAAAWLAPQAFVLLKGLILVGACPGGTASNVMTYLVRGDVALSVAMTAASTLIVPLATLWLAGARVDVPALAMLVDILRIVLLPVLAGVLLRRYLGGAAPAQRRGSGAAELRPRHGARVQVFAAARRAAGGAVLGVAKPRGAGSGRRLASGALTPRVLAVSPRAAG